MEGGKKDKVKLENYVELNRPGSGARACGGCDGIRRKWVPRRSSSGELMPEQGEVNLATWLCKGITFSQRE